MQNSKVRTISFTLLSLLPAITLALVPTMNKYFKIAHGPIEGPHNRTFLLAFFLIFWVLFLSLALLRSKKLKAKLTIRGLLQDVVLDGLIGALVGYTAAFAAYLMMASLSHRLGGVWADRPDMPYLFLVLLLGNYCWLLGSLCFVIFDVLIHPLKAKPSATGYAPV